jgi:hypothetical protein
MKLKNKMTALLAASAVSPRWRLQEAKRKVLTEKGKPHKRPLLPMVPVSGCKFAVLLVGFGPIT